MALRIYMTINYRLIQTKLVLFESQNAGREPNGYIHCFYINFLQICIYMYKRYLISLKNRRVIFILPV